MRDLAGDFFTPQRQVAIRKRQELKWFGMGGMRFARINGIRVSSVDPNAEKHGRLLRLGRTFRLKDKSLAIVECDCGSVLVAYTSDLVTGHTASCGCWHREGLSNRSATHRLRKSPEYNSWANMKARCLNPENSNYGDYGGRGITVCDRWLNSFERFYADMGPRPTPWHSIDRFPDNNGNYEPGNCRWATKTEQSNNQRTNRLLTSAGQTRTIAEWSRISGISYRTILDRLKRGWACERAVSQSVCSKVFNFVATEGR